MMSEKILNLNSTSPIIARLMQPILANWRRWQTNASTRRQLTRLTCAQLRDIGVSRAEVIIETTKPFWYNEQK